MQYPAVTKGEVAGVGEVLTSMAGNIVIRVGRDNEAGWEKSEHIVLAPEVARAFARDVLCQADTVLGHREIAASS